MRPPFLINSFESIEGIYQYFTVYDEEGVPVDPLYNTLDHGIPRHLFKSENWPLQSNTRITYCRPISSVYLFLVDPPSKTAVVKRPSEYKIKLGEPSLRFPYSINTGGVELPRPYRELLRPYGEFTRPDRQRGDFISVFDSIATFLQHPWHFDLLFDVYENEAREGHSVIPGPAFVYLLTSCLWEEKLRDLDTAIQNISFHQFRNPKLEINNTLHDRRKDLANFKTELTKMSKHVPADVDDYFERYWYGGENYSRITPNVTKHFESLIQDATRLESFLMETFTLFMSAINVQDARMSIEQAQRGSQLTLLAFIYIPLSFVTGVFGMNVQQINGTGLSVWVCFVTLVAVVLLTVPVFWYMRSRALRNTEYASKV